jgi:hypothetical protein
MSNSDSHLLLFLLLPLHLISQLTRLSHRHCFDDSYSSSTSKSQPLARSRLGSSKQMDLLLTALNIGSLGILHDDDGLVLSDSYGSLLSGEFDGVLRREDEIELFEL